MAIKELTDSYAAVVEYYTAVLSYLNTPSSIPPLMSSYIGKVQYTELLTKALSGTGTQSNFANASTVDSVHRYAGIVRDFSLRNKTRTDYYNDAKNSAYSDMEYLKLIKDRNVALLEGRSNNV